MADIWLPGFERVHNAKSGGGTYVPGARYRWTGHTTEGISSDPASSAARHENPPQCWVTLPSHPYRPRWRGQIIPLNRSGFALKHNDGDPETNKAGAIQVEIEGYSADASSWSRQDLDWLADEVVGPMCDAMGIKVAITVDTGAAYKRMSWDTWANYQGLCCHRNVPGNTHTDAPIDLGYISQRLLSAQPSPPTPGGSADMAEMWQHADGRQEYTFIDLTSLQLKTRWEQHAGQDDWTSSTVINTPGWPNAWQPGTFAGYVKSDGNFQWIAQRANDGGQKAGLWARGWYSPVNGWNGPLAL